MTEKTKPLVVVLSRNYSTGLGVIRSLGSTGRYEIDLIASTKKQGSSIIASSSRYLRRSVEVLSPKIQGDDGSELVEELKKYDGSYDGDMVIFPTDDFTASVVDRNRSELDGIFHVPFVSAEKGMSVTELMDKTVQGKMAEKAGLKTPREWTVSLRSAIEIPEDISYPCFVKPLQSVSGHKTEMAACNNREELSVHLDKMQNFFSDREVLIQEFLHIDKEYDLSGVCIDQKVIIPAIIEKTHIAQHELGVTMAGRLISADVLGEKLEAVLCLLKDFRYTGMFDMELNVCGEDIYFNEVNLRSGGPNFSYFLSGANLPAIVVDELLYDSHDEEDEKIETISKSFVYEKVAWEDYINGYMTYDEMKDCIDGADFKLLDYADDPEPGKIFARRIRLSALKHRMLQLAGKEKPKAPAIRKPQAVIIGRNYANILAMTRALGEAGYDVEVLRIYKKKPSRINPVSRMKPDAHSRYVKKYIEFITGDSPQRAAGKILSMADSRKKVLIPVDDYTACIVDNDYELLREKFFVPGVDKKQGEIVRLMNKNVQKKLAEEAGLPILESRLIISENGRFELPEDIPYPCFIKPNISMNSTKSKMAKCESREELNELLTKYAAVSDFEILVEEYVDIKHEYSILGLSDGKNSISPGIFRVIEGGHRERKGVAISGEAVSAIEMEPLISKCNEFILSLKYVGMFDIDLIETHDEKIYFVEINFRAGASMHLFTKMGINMPGLYADCFIKGRSIEGMRFTDVSGCSFVSEKVLIEEYMRNDIGKEGVRDKIQNADVHFVIDEKDPKPFRNFRRYYPIATAMRWPYKLRDRNRSN